ncbi:hypothetical protein ALP51_02225, partial [Pseudomonas savastanoi]
SAGHTSCTYSAVAAGAEISAQIHPQALSGIQRNSRIDKAVIEHIADHPAVKASRASPRRKIE